MVARRLQLRRLFADIVNELIDISKVSFVTLTVSIIRLTEVGKHDLKLNFYI